MKEINNLTEYTIKLTSQELRDLQAVCNDTLIMHPERKGKNNLIYDLSEKYYHEIDKVINKKYKE